MESIAVTEDNKHLLHGMRKDRGKQEVFDQTDFYLSCHLVAFHQFTLFFQAIDIISKPFYCVNNIGVSLK